MERRTYWCDICGDECEKNLRRDIFPAGKNFSLQVITNVVHIAKSGPTEGHICGVCLTASRKLGEAHWLDEEKAQVEKRMTEIREG